MRQIQRKTVHRQGPLEIAGLFAFRQLRFRKHFIKPTASLLALSLLFTQTAWAIDVRQMLADAYATFEEEDALRPTGMAPSQLASAQETQQAAVEQQQALEDLQSMNFTLKTAAGDELTYVGSKLDKVQRPDGTLLKNITTDAAGNILSSDLRLADGSVQVFQNGQVIGARMPDGTQVVYEGGRVQKTVSPSGVETLYTYLLAPDGSLTQTLLESSAHRARYDAQGRLVENLRKSDNQKTLYDAGILQKIIHADGSETVFDRQSNGTDTVLTPQGGSSSGTVLDAAGNKYSFSSGSVSSIQLAAGGVLENISWDAQNRVDSATLTDPDGSRYIYQAKQLTRSYDPAGTVTNYTYTASSILAAKNGNTWEYTLDGAPLKYTGLDGSSITYNTVGAYKGLKNWEKLSTGQQYAYEYATVNSVVSALRWDIISPSSYSYGTSIYGHSNIANSTNPVLKANFRFDEDGTTSQTATFIARGSSTASATLDVRLKQGTGSSYYWSGTNSTSYPSLTLAKGVTYEFNMAWETSRVAVYIWPSGTTRPTTPTFSVSNRAWDPKFELYGSNSFVDTISGSSGGYNRNTSFGESGSVYRSLSPTEKLDFVFKSASSSNQLVMKAVQLKVGDIVRTLTFSWANGTWTVTRSDANQATGQTANATTYFNQSLSAGTPYTAELRTDGSKANLYVYAAGQTRPEAATAWADAYSTSSKLSNTAKNALVSSFRMTFNKSATSLTPAAAALTARVNTVKNSTIVKPTAPSGLGSSEFASITYGADRQLKQVLFKDGSKLHFEQGLLKEAYDTSGKLTTFDFEQSGLSNLLSATISQPNLVSTYAADGKLSSVKTGDITVHYKPDGSTVEWIEKSDGTELWELVFDASGALTGALIYAPDGEIRKYAGSKLVGVERPDQSLLRYANDKPVQLVTPDKLTYDFVYHPDRIEAVLSPASAAPDTLSIAKMEYDLSFNLKKAVRQNQEVLNYLNTDLVRIDAPSEAPRVFSYQKDTSGKVLSYTVTQANVVTTYDAQDNPVSAVIQPTVENPDTFHVTYQYGRIRQIQKNGTVAFTYSYTFDDQTEQAVVEDLPSNRTLTYRGGELITALDKATNVLTRYEYAAAKVSRVTLSRFGRLLHDYVYAYDGEDTLVTDDRGVVRTYGPDQKLKTLERDGETFAYSYETVDVEVPGGSVETVLPVGLYDTTYRSVKSWDGQQAWFSWGQASGDDYLVTYWGGQYLDYAVNAPANGQLKIGFQAVNQDTDGLPAGYTSFHIEVFVDGVSRGIQYVPAHATQWQTYTFTLEGIATGSHTVRLKWLNDQGGANGTDANFKFRNLKFTHVGSGLVTQARPITTESLIEKRLAGGTLVRYQNGKISSIEWTDGRKASQIQQDSDGVVTQLRWHSNASDPGTLLHYSSGRVSRAVLSSGQELTYRYTQDPAGTVLGTEVQKGAVRLQYDAQGALTRVRMDGVLTPEEIAQAAVHTYSGGVGALSIDGDFNTAQSEIKSGPNGGHGATATSEHSLSFEQPQVVRGLKFRMAAFAWAHGNYTRNCHAEYRVEILRNDRWEIVPETHYYASGGDDDIGRDSGIVSLTSLALENVTAIRAFANGFGNASGDEGNAGGSASIYEIQFTLADLANLSFTQTGSGQTAQYSLSGYRGALQFNAQGTPTQTHAAYASVQSELQGVIGQYASVPFESADLADALGEALDPQSVLQQEFSEEGVLETQIMADGSVMLFESGRPSVVLGADGQRRIEYTYDAAGRPTRVHLKHARDALPQHMEQARQDIEKQRAQSLRELAAQKNLAYQSIRDQAEQNRQILESQRQILQSQFDQASSQSARGKTARAAKSDRLSEIQSTIQGVDAQIRTVYDQEADAYKALDAQAASLSTQIETDAAAAENELARQEDSLKREVLRQEVSPLVYDAYRRILGRDPSSAEYDTWIAQIDYASGAAGEAKLTSGQLITSALSSSLNNSPELTERQAYVNTVKQSVRTAVQNYLAMSDAQKQAYAASLGLSASDLIALSSSDATAILSWLDSRSLHFGQSAFLALESLLDQKGIAYTRTDLAVRVIVADILSGVITPLDDGDLVLSLFALRKVAATYGVSISAAQIGYSDLLSLSDMGARTIAHVNGNHFVVVTSVTTESVTYIDTGIGRDKQNQSVTVSKEEFLKIWKGHIAADSQALTTTTQKPGSTVRALSVHESQNIRGAFLGFLFFAAKAIFSAFAGAFVTIATSIGGFLTTVGQMIQGALATVGQALGSFAKGAGVFAQKVFGAVKFAASTIFKGIGGSVLSSQASQTVFGGFVENVFGAGLFKTVLQSSLGVVVSKALDALGLNPTATALISTIATGGALGGFTEAGFQIGKAFGGALTGALISGSQLVMQNAGIDGPLSQTLSLIASPLVAGFQSHNVSGALIQIAKELPVLGSYYGVQKISDALGIDPRLSMLVATPIAGIVTGLSKTLFSGSSRMPDVTIKEDSYRDQSTRASVRFEGPTPTWWSSVTSFVQSSLPIMSMSANSSYYLSRSQSISDSPTSLVSTTSTPGIPEGAVPVQYSNYSTGQTMQGYRIGTPTHYTVFDAYTGVAVMRVTPEHIEHGRFAYEIEVGSNGLSLDYGRPLHLSEGKITYTPTGGGRAALNVAENTVQEIYIEAPGPEVVLKPGATTDASGKVLNGVVDLISLGLSIFVQNGTPTKDTSGESLSAQEVASQLTTAFIFGNGFENKSRPENTPDPLMQSFADALREDDKLTNSLREFIVYLYEPTKMIGNAIDWLTDFQFNDDEKNFIAMILGGGQRLINFMLNPGSLASVPDRFLDQYSFWKDWYYSNRLGLGNNLVQETFNELQALQAVKGAISNGIAFAHSGFTAPILNTIELANYDVKTVLIYEGPYPDYTRSFTNRNLQRIIHVQGTGGPLEGDAWVPFLGEAKFDGANPAFENINIKIEGAFHSDFSYDEAEWDAKIAVAATSAKLILQREKERNRRVNIFMRQLYQAALTDQTTPGRLELFLSNTAGVEYDTITKFGTVTLDNLSLPGI